MTERGRYLFAVARGLDPQRLAGTTGLRGAPLEVVEHRGLQAVVCDVDLAEFGEDALTRNLEDLGWLEEVARGHDAVVRAVAEAGTMAPMRLVTIYAGDPSVRTRVQEMYDELTAVLDRVEGRREWSVKAYAVATDPGDPQAVPAGTGAGAGAAYLQRKKQQADRRRAASERSVEVAEDLHTRLAAHAVASRRLQPQDPRLTGRTEPMILNGAYLVDVEGGQAFADTVAELAAGLTGEASLELAGPWPPYSFAVLD